MRLRFALASAIALTLPASSAHANTEIDAYDARALGMAGSGMIENGAALFQNPAALHATEHLAVTAVVSPIMAWGRAPLTGDGVQSTSGPVASPLFLLGANVRLLDRLVVGATAYPSTAYGASFPQKGTSDAKVAASAATAALGASFAIVPELAIGGALDASWASEHLENYQGTSGDVGGHTLVGGQLGVYWRPRSNLRFGLAWRSKQVIPIGGSATLAGTPVELSTRAATPNSFKAGAQIGLLDERLNLAIGVGYWMFADSNLTDLLTVTVQGQSFPPQPTVYDWNDSYAGTVGAEYWLLPRFALRGGIGAIRSATPYAKPSPFGPPPGWITSLATGAGLRLDRWDLDLGAAYSFDTAHVDHPVQDPPTALGPAPPRYAGTYALADVLVSFAATFRF